MGDDFILVPNRTNTSATNAPERGLSSSGGFFNGPNSNGPAGTVGRTFL